MLDVLLAKLALEGYEVEGAEDGEETLEKIKKKPDAILLDILLPKKSGMEILEELQGFPDLLSIPIIIISNSGQPVEVERAKKLGVKDFLVKTDFTPQEVLEKLSHFLPPPARANGSAPRASLAPSNGKHYPKSDKGTVLIVEDDAFLKKLLADKLRREGFQVEQVDGGKEALEYLSRETPIIVLLDLVMPGIDGFQVLEEIRKDQSKKNMPVMVLSNLGEQENIERARSLGANDYLIKAHFIIDEIIERISALVAKKR